MKSLEDLVINSINPDINIHSGYTSVSYTSLYKMEKNVIKAKEWLWSFHIEGKPEDMTAKVNS